MLFDLVNILQQKRRLLFIALFAILSLWAVAICNQVLQAHRSEITSRIQRHESAQTLLTYQSEVLDGNVTANISHSLDSFEISFLRTTVSATDAITKAEHVAKGAARATMHAVATAVSALIRFVGTVFITIVRIVGKVLVLLWRVVTFPFVMTGKSVGFVSRAASGAANGGFASVIQPPNDMDVPVITPEQAHQVTIIQENTVAVEPVKPAGSGGACDNGAGNGGYPKEWCDARMDTIRTVAYSNDRINRQCTSYAYWYFTAIEGHADFRVTGNANRWAKTSNYPVHATPAVGAIAVETRGYYGHVAIVQALPGQLHDGKLVPEGYILVSEMNYDWQGHFRYSYSPLGKFSAYIYP
jgi:surface antigen